MAKLYTFFILFFLTTYSIIGQQCTVCDVTVSSTDSNINAPTNGTVCVPAGVTWTGEFFGQPNGTTVCVEGTWAPASNWTWDSGTNGYTIDIYGSFEATAANDFDIILEGTEFNTYTGSTVDVTGSFKVAATGGSSLVIGGDVTVDGSFETTSSVTVQDMASLTATNIRIEQKSGADFTNNGSITATNLVLDQEVITGMGNISVLNDFTSSGPNAGISGQTMTVQGTSSVAPEFCGNSSGNTFCDFTSFNSGNLDSGCLLSPEQINCSLLPITLKSFNSRKLNQTHYIVQWTAEKAENFSHFELEYSFDGKSFESYGSYAYREGNNSYTTEQMKISEEDKYFRLKLVDSDGSYEYSDIISVAGTSPSTVKVYPNPAKEDFIYLENSNDNPILLNIFSMNGEHIDTQHLNGKNKYQIALPRTSADILIFEIISGRNVVVKKILR